MKDRKHHLWAMLTLLLAFPLMLNAAPPKGWKTNLDEVKAISAKAGKPVMIMFSAEWCPPCKTMKESVFPDADVSRELQNFIPAYIDTDQQEKLSESYQVQGMPTFVFLDTKGMEIARFSGGTEKAPEFADGLRQVNEFFLEVKALDAEIAKAPDNPEPWKRKGDLMTTYGNFTEGQKAYAEAKKRDPQNRTGVLADLDFVETMGLLDKDRAMGVSQLETFEKRHPGHARNEDVLYLRAMVKLNEKDPRPAEPLLREYLKRYPEGRFLDRVNRMLEMLAQYKTSAK